MKKNRLRSLLYVLLAFGICIGILMPTVPVYAAADTIDGYVMDAETLSDGTIGILFIRGGSSSEGVISGSGTLWYAVYDPSGRWTEEPVISDETVAKEASLAIHDDVAHVAYTTADDKIAYTYQTDTGWAEAIEIETNNAGESSSGVLSSPDLAIDTDGSFYLTYYDTKGSVEGCDPIDKDHGDGMLATDSSGVIQKSVIVLGCGTYEPGSYGSTHYQEPMVPSKIAFTDTSHYVVMKRFDTDREGNNLADKSYYILFRTARDTGASYELNAQIYEACGFGSAFYTLVYANTQYSVIQYDGTNVSMVSGTSNSEVAKYAADMTLDDDGYIYYAAASGSNILFHQNGTPATGELENAIHSNHNKLATVLSDGVQYAIYTNTDGKIVVANPDGEDVNEVLPIGKEPEDASAVDFTATGYDTGIVSGLVVGEPYTIQFDDDDAVEITPESTEYELTDIVLTSPDESTPASTTLTVIKKATDEETMADSTPRTFTITRADKPALAPVQPAEIDGTGSIPTTEYHEYTTDDPSDEDTEWLACEGNLLDLEPGTYYVRVAATGTVLTSDPQEIEIVEYDPPKETTPTVTFTATGTSTASLSGLSGSADDQYTLSGTALGEAGPYTVDGTVTELTGLEPGTLSIVKNGNLITTIDSDAQTITITRAESDILSYTHPSAEGEYGTIETDDTYEYTTTNPVSDPDAEEIEWTACTGELEVPEGTYYLRIKATGTVLASDTCAITLIVPSYLIYDGDNNEIGAYREWSEVAAVIAATDDSEAVLKVKITNADDVLALNNFKFPKSAKSIVFTGAVPDDGGTIPATIKYSGDLTLTCDTTFEDLYFEQVDATSASTGALKPMTLNMAGSNLTFAGDVVTFDTPLNINDASKQGTVKFSEGTNVRACGADNVALSSNTYDSLTLAVIEGSITNVAAVDLGTPLVLSDYPTKEDNTAFAVPTLSAASLVSRYSIDMLPLNAAAVKNDSSETEAARTAAAKTIGTASATITNLTLLEGTTSVLSSGVVTVTEAKLYAGSGINAQTIKITDLTLSGENITVYPVDDMTVTGTTYIQALSEVSVLGSTTLNNVYISNAAETDCDAFIAHPVLADGTTFAINGTVTVAHAGDKLKIGLLNETGELLDIESRLLLYTTTQKTVSGLVVPWLPDNSESHYTATFIENGNPNKIYAGRPVFCLYDGDDNEIGVYENWADVANLITATNNKEAVLKVKITEDVDVRNNLKFPKAAGSITFVGAVKDESDTIPATIKYSGNLALTCDTTFDNLCFEQVDARTGLSTGAFKPMTLNMAGHNLTFAGDTVKFDTPLNVNDSSKKGTVRFSEDTDFRAGGADNAAIIYYDDDDAPFSIAVLAGSITNVYSLDAPYLFMVDYPTNVNDTAFAVPVLSVTDLDIYDSHIEMDSFSARTALKNPGSDAVKKAAQKAVGATSATIQNARLGGPYGGQLESGTIKITNAYMNDISYIAGDTLQFTNLFLLDEPSIYADKTMTVTGTLTSYTSRARIVTKRDASGKKAGLNISGTVVLEDPADKITICIESTHNVYDDEDKVIGYTYDGVYGGYTLDPQLGYTGLLLDAKSADVSKFKLAEENQHKDIEGEFYKWDLNGNMASQNDNNTVRGEYSDTNTDGYILVKKGTGIYVFYCDEIVADVRDAADNNIGYYVS